MHCENNLSPSEYKNLFITNGYTNQKNVSYKNIYLSENDSSDNFNNFFKQEKDHLFNDLEKNTNQINGVIHKGCKLSIYKEILEEIKNSQPISFKGSKMDSIREIDKYRSCILLSDKKYCFQVKIKRLLARLSRIDILFTYFYILCFSVYLPEILKGPSSRYMRNLVPWTFGLTFGHYLIFLNENYYIKGSFKSKYRNFLNQ